MKSVRNPIFNALGLAVLFASLAPGSGAQPTSSSKVREPPDGEGVICSWATMTAVAEVGDTCFPGQNPALQAELRRSVARIDQYVLRNDRSMTSDKMAEF